MWALVLIVAVLPRFGDANALTLPPGSSIHKLAKHGGDAASLVDDDAPKPSPKRLHHRAAHASAHPGHKWGVMKAIDAKVAPKAPVELADKHGKKKHEENQLENSSKLETSDGQLANNAAIAKTDAAPAIDEEPRPSTDADLDCRYIFGLPKFTWAVLCDVLALALVLLCIPLLLTCSRRRPPGAPLFDCCGWGQKGEEGYWSQAKI